jgi:hypothetical protein
VCVCEVEGVRSGKQKGKRINRVEAEVGQHKKQHTAHHHTRSYNTATQQHSTTQHNTTLYNTTLQNINISAHLTSSYSTTQQRIQYHRPLQLHRNRFRCGGGEYLHLHASGFKAIRHQRLHTPKLSGTQGTQGLDPLPPSID